jgi:hypothetical protein
VRTESVYLDAVSPDGADAFVVRLQRNLGEATAWLWVHVFRGGEVWGSVAEDLPCGEAAVDPASAPCRYEDAASTVVFERHGGGPAMRGTLRAAAATPTGVPLRVEATFAVTMLTGDEGLLGGRTERHGAVEATITVGADSWTLDALGQWHEQHQDTPRFGVPFTYMTVRGAARSLVGLVTPRGSGALVASPAGAERVDQLMIDPPGPRRSVVAGHVGGTLRATYTYELPIGGHPRASSIVVGDLDGSPVSGCVNDWRPPADTP